MTRRFRLSVCRPLEESPRWAAGIPEAVWTETDHRRSHGYELEQVHAVIARLKHTQPQGSVITVY